MSSTKPLSVSVAPPFSSADGHGLPTTYTNVFRASGSSDELILDFGLDAHRRTPEGGEPALMLQRLVLTWGHAKRLAVLLRELVQMHEQSHGPIPPNPPSPS